MDVVQFLEYLHDRVATTDLADGLAQVFLLRRRNDLVPLELMHCATRRVAG